MTPSYLRFKVGNFLSLHNLEKVRRLTKNHFGTSSTGTTTIHLLGLEEGMTMTFPFSERGKVEIGHQF